MPCHLVVPLSSLFAKCIRAFRSDQRGNVVMIFAIVSIPILTGVGCAIDYSMAVKMRTRLQAAADIASVAAVAKLSPGFVAATSMTGDGPVTVGATDARFFRRSGSVAYGFGLFSRKLSFDDYASMFHGNDERVDVESLGLSEQLWEAVAHDLLD